MKTPKWKWWQWALAGVAVLIILGSINRCLNPGAYEAEKQAAVQASRATAVLDVRQVRRDPFPTYAMLVKAGDNGQILADKARDRCGASAFCDVAAWTDDNLRGRGFPYTDRESAGIVFTYRVNRNTGLDEAHWNCAIFPGFGPDQCLPQ